MLLILSTSILGQGGLDILAQPRHAASAAMGLNSDPIRQPHYLAAQNNEPIAVLNMWSWVADVSGLGLNIESGSWAAGIHVYRAGELEVRDEIPIRDPVSRFDYSLVSSGLGYGRSLDDLEIGVGLELIRERSLNASAWGVVLNTSASYPLIAGLQTSAGIRHLGGMQDLNTEASDLPTELWLRVNKNLDQLDLNLELNSGPAPVHMAGSYQLIRTIQLLAGLQLETGSEGLDLHPSTGLLINRHEFSLGFALSDLAHPLGMRQHYSLYWNF